MTSAERISGKTIVITGGSAGIGAAAARALREAGAQVIITGRSPDTRTVGEQTGSDYHFVDFAKFDDVRRFARDVLAAYPRIDILVNNAGAMYSNRQLTPDGHEMTLQVNHLSGFLLTNLLRERLEESRGVVINTSSGMSRYGRINFDDMESARDYNPARAYAAAKLMNVLHAMEINRRFNGVSGASFHPGGVATRFGRESRGVFRLVYETPMRRLFLISPAKGMDTLVWLAQGKPGEDWQPGGYYYKRRIAKTSRDATPELAAKLWDVSQSLIEG